MLKKILVLLAVVSFLSLGMGMEASAQQKVVTLKYGANYQAVQPIGQIVTMMAQKANEKSKGSLKIDTYFNAALGAEREGLESCQLGQIDMVGASEGIMGTFVPEWKFLALPFLIKDPMVFGKFVRSDVGKQFGAACEKVGLKMLMSEPIGFRNPVNNDRPITKAEDYKGLKVRTQQNPLQIDVMKALGSLPTALPVTEVYTAMQTGVVQGSYADWGHVWNAKWYEVCKYGTSAPLFPCTTSIFISKKSWDAKLSPEQQKILLESLDEALKNYYKLLTVEEEANMVKKLEGTGKIKINTLDPAQYAGFMKLLQPVYDNFLKTDPQTAPFVKYFQTN
jgi:TRAP-type transport system periplasmic protein